MLVIGLTGSIGMGKSTTARLFRAVGVRVNDADAVVHRLYAGRAAPQVERLFPGVVRNGVVDRAELAARVLGDAGAIRQLEGIVHPLVREEEQAFLASARRDGCRQVLLDIPLLFETGATGRVDVIVVVSAPAAVQRQRVLDRPGMTEAHLAAILARQTPDADKRRQAHFVVDSSHGLEPAARQVCDILRAMAAAVGGRRSD